MDFRGYAVALDEKMVSSQWYRWGVAVSNEREYVQNSGGMSTRQFPPSITAVRNKYYRNTFKLREMYLLPILLARVVENIAQHK